METPHSLLSLQLKLKGRSPISCFVDHTALGSAAFADTSSVRSSSSWLLALLCHPWHFRVLKAASHSQILAPGKPQILPSLELLPQRKKKKRDSTSYLSNGRQLISCDKHSLPLPEKNSSTGWQGEYNLTHWGFVKSLLVLEKLAGQAVSCDLQGSKLLTGSIPFTSIANCSFYNWPSSSNQLRIFFRT